MSYYDEIDPVGEEKKNKCLECGKPTNNLYFCSMSCCLTNKN